MAVETRWWRKEEDRIVCDLCPRRCRLPEGARGFCFVRRNEGGQMQLSTYGKSTGFCIDPIEKKPLNHFLPGTSVLSFGTAGCNLGCKFCQNWDISKSKEIEIVSATAKPEQIARAALDLGCRSVAFTYNDPVIWAEYALDTAIACHAVGLKTVAVTAGYITPEARGDFFEHIDAVNVDLKAFTADFYRTHALASLEPVLETLVWLREHTSVWLELTNLLIPGENDAPDELGSMSEWIVAHLGSDVPVHFTAFHPDYKMLHKPRTPHETLLRARSIAKQCGIRYAYVGNVLDLEHQSTYCPDCETLLIERDHYQLGQFEVVDSCCKNCGTLVPGVFENEPGTWGRRRSSVRIEQWANPPAPLEGSAEVQLTVVQERLEQTQQAVEELASREHISKLLRPLPDAVVRADYTSEELETLTLYTRSVVEAALKKTPCSATLAQPLAETGSFGVFVTLRRNSLLRACRGHWGDPMTATLGALIRSAATSAATIDPRFPSLTPSELSLLTIELSIMHDPQRLTAQGTERLEQVSIGTHGLVIAHQQGSGLLLPQVAADNGWSVETFLDRLCAKAGLAKGQWMDDDTELMTFRTVVAVRGAEEHELDGSHLPEQERRQMLRLVNACLGVEQTKLRISKNFQTMFPTPMGLSLEDRNGTTATAFVHNGSLLELGQSAAQALRNVVHAEKKPLLPVARATLLTQPIALLPAEYPARHISLGTSAVYAECEGEKVLALPTPKAPQDTALAALSSLGLTPAQWGPAGATLTAYQTWILAGAEETTGSIRMPAAAGRFYPATPEAVKASVERLTTLDAHWEKKPSRALLLPHAGWRFCGDIIARTLNRTTVDSLVMAIGPKHTALGAHWSITADNLWQLPHGQVTIATKFAAALQAIVPALHIERDAHRNEHAIEVLLPFLMHFNPRFRLLPLVLGPTSYANLELLATAIARLVEGSKLLPQFVVSSDMNHYAEEQENRRLDRMALDALLTGNPKLLYDVCTTHRISMCGMQPAVVVLATLEKILGRVEVELVDYCTSARTTGDTSRVVGYAGALLR
ncbi:MAG: AmmeMemoRadiSam system radical SAM enzyme [Bdellovibrionales bacterium]|nr:AmmeMemoRadiSam system radical SAM enzyme [Bdellovibrionales bacterium]